VSILDSLPDHDFPCQIFVEVVTDYLEGALPPDIVARIDTHLAGCPGCRSVLAQLRQVTWLSQLAVTTEVESLDPSTRQRLLDAFCEARRS
jgi:predicted anti-sigma-YlaC factor YlaD